MVLFKYVLHFVLRYIAFVYPPYFQWQLRKNQAMRDPSDDSKTSNEIGFMHVRRSRNTT